MLRLMTYNIRACLGLDGLRSPERIAEVISTHAPDVVALQEVDVERARSGGVNQAFDIAERLGMACILGHSFEDPEGGHYGNAILARNACRMVQHDVLRHLHGTEARSAMWVRIETDDAPIDVINTHLSFRAEDRAWQAEDLLSEHWLASPEIGGHVVLTGDLNCSPRDQSYRRLTADLLRDAHDDAPGHTRCTWPTRWPFRRLDHILISNRLDAQRAGVVRESPARIASDHLPVIADLAPAASAPDDVDLVGEAGA